MRLSTLPNWINEIKGQRPGRSHVVMALCPKCADKSGHLEVDTERGLYYCHRCGYGGSFALRGKERLPLSKPMMGDERWKKWDWTRLNEEDKDFRQFQYLLSRGFSPTMIIEDLQALIKNMDPWWVYFPIFNALNIWSYVTGRCTSNTKGNKWWFPSGPCGKSRNLWGLHRVVKGCHRVVLVEGIFDAVWSRDRLALLGSIISDEQIRLLQRLGPEEIIIALDGDKREEGYKMAVTIAKKYTVPIYVAFLPIDKDLDDLGHEGNGVIEETMKKVV